MRFGDIGERLGNVHPGVIQQDVQAVHAGEGGMHLLALGHIANDYARAAARVADAFCNLFKFTARSADQDYLGPCFGKSKRSCRADPATCSCNQRDAAIESKRRRNCCTFGCFRRGFYRVSPELAVTLTLRLP
jgi:hypothetical protein